ncbi:bifunctional PIG-L family deacetylase/class I SAM-dependent methyltransferase [Georgenia sp. H159]|uniref:bifunctional PIG-L family deacetylase/class I SAM-dependent methyltransferase n=1 Tax=Georgenia sp. H159 TaxID=3076115 RepID=UPI002D793F43|nr:bifunctional PIG-L family deacetylase/class I SAM-dependent methyltransferase [Georgenia sp. H159]
MELTPFGEPVTDESRWAEDPRWQDTAPFDLTEIAHLVVVAAHPDDETLGLGGLLAGLPTDVAVDIVVATDGDASHPDSPTHTPADLARTRRREAEHAVGLLAPHARLHLLGLPDGGLTGEQDELTAALVRLVRPGESVLVAPYRHDKHPDHEAAARAAAAAAWRTDTRLLEYPVWLWHWQGPDVLPWASVRRADLGPEERDRKARALAVHHSQVAPLSDLPGDEVLLPAEVLAHFARPWETLLVAEPGEASPFDPLHTDQADPWQVRTSWYEHRKRALTLAALPHERYAVGVEVGCSVGALAEDLLTRCGTVVAVDESSAALARVNGSDGLRTVRASLPEEWALLEEHMPGDVDLVVLSEVGYFLSPARLRALAGRVAELVSGAPRATVLACHWRHEIVGWPLLGDDVHGVLEEVLSAAGLRRHSHLVEDDVVLTTWCGVRMPSCSPAT